MPTGHYKRHVPVHLINQRFGRWVILYFSERPRSHNGYVVRCQCDCGTEKDVSLGTLRRGASQSCGCLAREINSRMHRGVPLSHGHCGRGRLSLTYRKWMLMKTRCRRHPHYLKTGIQVCAEWQQHFESFLADMGDCPPGITLDRIDNTRGYEPGNCRWATMREQGNNKSDNRLVTYHGQQITVAQLARECGLKYGTVLWRLDHGRTVAEAMVPVETHVSQNAAKSMKTPSQARAEAIPARDVQMRVSSQ